MLAVPVPIVSVVTQAGILFALEQLQDIYKVLAALYYALCVATVAKIVKVR